MSSRFDEARQNWSGLDIRWLWQALIGAVLGIALLLVLGWPWKAEVEAMILAGATVVPGVVFPLLGLVWAWLLVPSRRLRDDVAAIRDRLDATQSSEQPLPVQVRVHNAVRLGRELGQMGATPGNVMSWLNYIVESLGHDLPDDLPHVLQSRTFPEQLAALERIADRHMPPARRTTTLVSHRGGQAG